ncbi:MAG: helix-hairpin-helix domain-containing protein [Jiangellaceae bacterium]
MEWLWIILVVLVLLLLGWLLFGRRSETGADRSAETPGPVLGDTATTAGGVAGGAAAATGLADVDRPSVDADDLAAGDLAAPSVDLSAGESALGRSLSTDDLTLVEGIGPAIATLLGDAGVRTWEDLSGASTADLQAILDAGGTQFNMHDPSTWPEQAQLALRNDWDRLSELQERLRAGQR